MKLGSEWAGVFSGVYICPGTNSSLFSVQEVHACMAQSQVCLSSGALIDFTWCQTPGAPSAGILLNLDSLPFMLHLAKQSILPSLHPPLSPCRAILQWASNYSDWHMVRSYVKDIYLIYKQKIPQLIIWKETITFMVHFSNTRLLL